MNSLFNDKTVITTLITVHKIFHYFTSFCWVVESFVLLSFFNPKYSLFTD